MRALFARATVVAIITQLWICIAPEAARAQSIASTITPPPPGFSKIVIDANGNQTSGPVKAGDVITYVLTVDSTMTGPSAIVDNLSANQTYLPGSLHTPPDWTYDPTVIPYSVNNQMTYNHSGTLLAPGFTIDVPVNDAYTPPQTGATLGDGTLPITVGGKIYGIYHHQYPAGAKIMCLDGLSLVPCAGGWPRKLSTAVDLATPALLKHAVWAGKIFYSAVRVQGPNTNHTFTPGIGCFDSATQVACANFGGFSGGFFPLPDPASGPITWASSPTNQIFPMTLGRYMSPIVADPADGKRLFIQADHDLLNSGKVYCVDVSIGALCPGWSTPTLTIGSEGAGVAQSGTVAAEATSRDMIVATVAPGQQRLFIHHPGTTPGTFGTISCLALPTGTSWSTCPGWFNATVPSGRAFNHGALTPVLNTIGSATHICVHYYKQAAAGLPSCFNSNTGSFDLSVSNTVTKARVWVGAYRMPTPGNPRLLYPTGANASIECRDFPANTVCPASDFKSNWGANTPTNSQDDFKDYGYAVDPTQPKRCLLGLGDSGWLWRFTRSGGFDQPGQQGVPIGCTKLVQAQVKVDDLFCGYKPQGATWKAVTLINRPQQLSGGTVKINGTTHQIPSSGSGPITVLNLPATGANGTLNIEINPLYSSPTVSNGYQLRVALDSNVAEQICYKATVMGCGPVTNQAAQITGTLGNFQVRQAATNLGDAICQDLHVGKAQEVSGSYTMQVLNKGAPIQGKAKIVMQDLVPPGLIVNTINAPAPWTCAATLPVHGPDTITCSYEVPAGTTVPLGPLPNIGLTTSGQPSKPNCVQTALFSWLSLPLNLGGFWLPVPESLDTNNNACAQGAS